jgi:hypothetical protein
MGVKESRGDFFSKFRSLKDSFYPKFFIKKFMQWPLKTGSKNVVFKRLLRLNSKLVYMPLSCRRVDLLFSRLVYASLFKFRSTNLVYIRRRSNKTVKKKFYGNLFYSHLEKSSVKLFSSMFNKNLMKKDFLLFFLFQKYFKKRVIKNYRKQCYSSLTSLSVEKKEV